MADQEKRGKMHDLNIKSKRAKKEWKEQEVHIQLHKDEGKEHSNMVFTGTRVGLLTAVCCMMDKLTEYTDITVEDIRKCFDTVQQRKGDE